jgi:hypothetical protein
MCTQQYPGFPSGASHSHNIIYYSPPSSRPLKKGNSQMDRSVQDTGPSLCQNQSCWRSEGLRDRDEERGRGLCLDEPFFLILARSSISTRYFKWRKNSYSISPSSFKNYLAQFDRVRGLYTPRPPPKYPRKCGFLKHLAPKI